MDDAVCKHSINAAFLIGRFSISARMNEDVPFVFFFASPRLTCEKSTDTTALFSSTIEGVSTPVPQPSSNTTSLFLELETSIDARLIFSVAQVVDQEYMDPNSNEIVTPVYSFMTIS
jgi:hypothetical protein